MYEYVKAIPQSGFHVDPSVSIRLMRDSITEPLTYPKKLVRKEGEPDRRAERRKHAEVAGEWNAVTVTCVALYTLLIGLSQKGIDSLKQYQGELERRFPDDDVGVSEEFEDGATSFVAHGVGE
jgi:serine/threonine-protein kinase ULK/ATG1